MCSNSASRPLAPVRNPSRTALAPCSALSVQAEATRAIAAGADALKLFPAELAGPQGLKAMRAVLPKSFPVFPVGGIDPDTARRVVEAGADALVAGTATFRGGPGAYAANIAALRG